MAGFESPTLMQENTVVTSIELVEGGNIIRQGHHLTIGYVAYDEVGEVVDLSGKELTVSIWGRKGIAFEADAVFEDGVLRFTLDQALPSGDYNVEFTATLSTDAGYRKKYPTNTNTGRISVKQSADDLGAVGISVFTIDKFEKKQKALQDAYHLSVDSKVETLEADFEQAVGALTVDSEVVLARGEASTLRARLDAEKNAVTAQLAEKAKQAELEATGKRIDELIIGSGDANAEVTDAHVSVPKNKTFDTIGNRFEEAEREMRVPIKNIVTNGDFSKGLDGWFSDTALTLSATDKALTAKGNNSIGAAKLFQTTSQQAIAGHKIYMSTKIKPISSFSKISLALRGTTSDNNQLIVKEITNPAVGITRQISGIGTVPPTVTGFLNTVSVLTASDINGLSAEYRNFLTIDLTAIYGAGNEPELLQIEGLLSYFENNWFSGTAPVGDLTYAVSRMLNTQGDKFATYARNIVPNGDFSEGYSGWTNGANTSVLSLNSGSLVVTGNGTSGIPRAIYAGNKNVIAGHKYYGRAKVKAGNPDCQRIWVESYGGLTQVGLYKDVQMPVENMEYTLSGIVTAPASSGLLDFRVLNRYADTATANGKSLRIDDVVVIDLTEMFGAGNEPTVHSMDALIKDAGGYVSESEDIFQSSKLIAETYPTLEKESAKNNYFYTPTGADAYDGTGKSGLNAETITVAQLNALWDSLIANYPNQLSKSVLGKDATGIYDIYRINYKPIQPKAKILISANVHGNSSWGDPKDISLVLYEFVKDILENNITNEAMTFFRYNIELEMMPCANPWGYDNDQRHNGNDVDINRDFYSATPQPETVIIKNWLAANTDAILYLDHHAYANSRTDNMLKVYANADGHSENYVAREVGEYIERKQGLLLSVSDAEEGMTISYGWGDLNIPSITLEYPVYYTGAVPHSKKMTNDFLQWTGSYLYRYALENYNLRDKKLQEEIDAIKAHLGIA